MGSERRAIDLGRAGERLSGALAGEFFYNESACGPAKRAKGQKLASLTAYCAIADRYKVIQFHATSN